MTIKRYLNNIAFSEKLGRQMRFITGPRQAGKTTIAKQQLAHAGGGLYYNWDNKEVRARYREGGERVYFKVVAEEEDPVEDVGEFFGNFRFIGFYVIFYFGGVLPLEVLQQFGGFEGEGDGDVFGIVELRPVARVAERDDLLGEALDVAHAAPPCC